MKALYPEWLKYKAVETSKANANKLQWVWNTYFVGSDIADMDMQTIDVITLKTWFLNVIEKHKLSNKKYKVLASGEISHLESEENDQSQPDRNDQCTSFSFL